MKSELKDLASRLQGIISTAIDGIITIDDKGIVETVNQSAAEYFKYEPNEIIGNNVSMLMPEPDKSNHDEYIDRYKKTRVKHIIGIGREVVGKKKNGDLFPFRLAVSEVVLNDRVIFTGIIHDLTDVKNAEKKLIDLNNELESQVEARTNELESVVNQLLVTNQQLEQREKELTEALEKEKELNELKSRFVSMASHEFRTPLSMIMSSASLISRYTDEDQQDKREKHIGRIKNAVDNLTGILNDFLSLSKIEEGEIRLDIKNVDINELCSSVIDQVTGLLSHDQTIQHQNHLENPSIKSDPHILKNILFNIISNAIKYSGPKDIIFCRTFIEDKMITFEIKDTGIGIPDNDQKYLFERFFRASNVENIQGTGLGLNIVKRYIDMLSGEISFSSKENEGTTFTIKIPQV